MERSGARRVEKNGEERKWWRKLGRRRMEKNWGRRIRVEKN